MIFFLLQKIVKTTKVFSFRVKSRSTAESFLKRLLIVRNIASVSKKAWERGAADARGLGRKFSEWKIDKTFILLSFSPARSLCVPAPL